MWMEIHLVALVDAEGDSVLITDEDTPAMNANSTR